MRSSTEQAAIRQDIFAWLERQEIELGGYQFRRDCLREKYSYGGEIVALIWSEIRGG